MGEASIGSDTYPPAVSLSDGVLASLDQPDSASRPNRASLQDPSWVKLLLFDSRTTVDHEVKRQQVDPTSAAARDSLTHPELSSRRLLGIDQSSKVIHQFPERSCRRPERQRAQCFWNTHVEAPNAMHSRKA